MSNQRWENAIAIKRILEDNQDYLDNTYGLRIEFFIDIPSDFVICCVYKIPSSEMIGVIKCNPYHVFYDMEYVYRIALCDVRNVHDTYPINPYMHTLTEAGRKAIEHE